VGLSYQIFLNPMAKFQLAHEIFTDESRTQKRYFQTTSDSVSGSNRCAPTGYRLDSATVAIGAVEALIVGQAHAATAEALDVSACLAGQALPLQGALSP